MSQTAFSIRFNTNARQFPIELFKVHRLLRSVFDGHDDFYDGNDFTAHRIPDTDKLRLSYGSLFYAFPKHRRNFYINEVSRILKDNDIEFFVGCNVPRWSEAPLEGTIETDLLIKWIMSMGKSN